MDRWVAVVVVVFGLSFYVAHSTDVERPSFSTPPSGVFSIKPNNKCAYNHNRETNFHNLRFLGERVRPTFN